MLRNWPIRRKLVAVLLVPLIALIAFGAISVDGAVRRVTQADRIETAARFSLTADRLLDALQQERFTANQLVGSNYAFGAADFTAARGPVDTALRAFRSEASQLPAAATGLRTQTAGVEKLLTGLAARREAIDKRTGNLNENFAFYIPLTTQLLTLNDQITTGSTDRTLLRLGTGLAALAQAKDNASQQRGYVASLLITTTPSPARNTLISTVDRISGLQQAWTTELRSADLAGREPLLGPVLAPFTADTLRDRIVGQVLAGTPTDVTVPAWLAANSAQLAQMRQAETALAGDLSSRSREVASSARTQALVSGLAIALVIALSIALSVTVVTPMTRQLRRLRGAALDVATVRLPDVVARLQRGESVEINPRTSGVRVSSRDEIGQVAEAFNTVHGVALSTAAEQAAMRKSIGDTFLNLARRSQALVHRQLKVIDGLERKQSDPDELQELFRLDHLATRMRRHAEDLIVLSGAKPSRGWRRPVNLQDIVRGAVAEVEDYTRVKVAPISGVAVSGHAVGDVIHLLAELIENATSFSPPETPVAVEGHAVSNGCVIEIEDRGLGMSPSEYDSWNARLEKSPQFDLRTSERLGLFVVSKLAERHEITVRLRPSEYGGTTAIVMLPGSLVRSEDDAEPSASPVRLRRVIDAADDLSPEEEPSATAPAPPVRPGPPVIPPRSATPTPPGTPARSAPVSPTRPTPRVPSAPAPRTEVDPPTTPGLPVPVAKAAPAPTETAGAAAADATAAAAPELPAWRTSRFTTMRPSWFVPERELPDVPAKNGGPATAHGSTTNGAGAPVDLAKHPQSTVDPEKDTAAATPAAATPDPVKADPVKADGTTEDAATTGEGPAELPRRRRATRPVGEPEPAGTAAAGTNGSTPGSTADPDPAERTAGGTGIDLRAARAARIRENGLAETASPAAPPAPEPAPASASASATPTTTPPATPAARPPDADRKPPLQTTDVGLPKRTRRAHLMPQLRGRSRDANTAPGLAGPRSPEEVRSMMSSFQTNFDRGLQDAPQTDEAGDQDR